MNIPPITRVLLWVAVGLMTVPAAAWVVLALLQVGISAGQAWVDQVLLP